MSENVGDTKKQVCGQQGKRRNGVTNSYGSCGTSKSVMNQWHHSSSSLSFSLCIYLSIYTHTHTQCSLSSNAVHTSALNIVLRLSAWIFGKTWSLLLWRLSSFQNYSSWLFYIFFPFAGVDQSSALIINFFSFSELRIVEPTIYFWHQGTSLVLNKLDDIKMQYAEI